MDRLTYAYKPGNNQLTSVSDEVPAPRYDNDIDSQEGDNYDYDEIDNLTADAQGEIENIEWTVRGKIKKITRTEESTQPQLEFDYGPMGNRVESPGSVAWECNSKAAPWELLTDTGGYNVGTAVWQFPSLTVLESAVRDWDATIPWKPGDFRRSNFGASNGR